MDLSMMVHGIGAEGLTWSACFFRFFARASSRWFPRAMVDGWMDGWLMNPGWLVGIVMKL